MNCEQLYKITTAVSVFCPEQPIILCLRNDKDEAQKLYDVYKSVIKETKCINENIVKKILK